MKALVLEAPGEPPRLVVKQVPRPAVGPRDVLVQVRAAGVCWHDILVARGVLRRGVKPQLVLGHEVSGEVVETGALVSTLFPGDKVVALLTEPCGLCRMCSEGREHRCLNGVGIGHGTDGGFAEYLKIAETGAVKVPPEADPLGACLYACPMGVALHALGEVAGLRAGETVVVTGAGGGLGAHAVQVARASGAWVLAVTTSPHKVEGLRRLGADEVLLSPEAGFGEEVLALTEERGAEVVFHTLGTVGFAEAWKALAPFGRLLVVGDLGGGTIPLPPAELLFKDARILGVAGTNRRQVQEVARMAALGRVRPVVARTYPLAEATAAFEEVASHQQLGRVVLLP